MIACTLSDAERRKETYTLHLIIMFYAFGMCLKRFMTNGVKLRLLLASHNSQWQIKFAGTKQTRFENTTRDILSDRR